MTEETNAAVTAVVVGAGHRSLLYADYSLEHQDALSIVGVAEPDEVRRAKAAERFGIPPERCFKSAEELVRQPACADAVINGTMDDLHVSTSLPLLEAGYHVLLEKPITPDERELQALLHAVENSGKTVMICHVLRYAPFYVAIRQAVADGKIGEIMAIHTSENVSYHHMGAAFIRGKWGKEGMSPMLLQKCCHDLDLVCWFKAGLEPRAVASFGSLMFFREDHAPRGAGSRCLVDCEIEPDCPYSAKKNYIEQDLWGEYVWHSIEHIPNAKLEQKLESLRTTNPYGRCVWRCDNDVVDHQSVIVEFEDGGVATHDMVGGVSKPCRTIHLYGTKGEIEGTLEDGYFVIRKPDARQGCEYSEERVELNVSHEMHGGGDHRLVEDFVRVIRGQSPSISTTDIMDSIHGHQVVYAANKAMRERRMVEVAS